MPDTFADIILPWQLKADLTYRILNIWQITAKPGVKVLGPAWEQKALFRDSSGGS